MVHDMKVFGNFSVVFVRRNLVFGAFSDSMVHEMDVLHSIDTRGDDFGEKDSTREWRFHSFRANDGA